MKSGAGSSTEDRFRDLSRGDWDALGRSVGTFVDALRRGTRPDMVDHLPDGGPTLRHVALVEMIHEELEFRLKSGESAGADDYLARFPELAGDPSVVRDLTRAELRLKGANASRRRRR